MSYTLKHLTDAWLAEQAASGALNAAMTKRKEIERAHWQFYLKTDEPLADVRDDGTVITVTKRSDDEFYYLVSKRVTS